MKALHPYCILKELKGFIGLIIQNRHLIPFFIKRIALLQALKIKLLSDDNAKTAQAKGKTRRIRYVQNKRIQLSRNQRKVFEDLKAAMINEEVLFHFNASKRLYIFIDVSKIFNYGVIIYESLDSDDKPF